MELIAELCWVHFAEGTEQAGPHLSEQVRRETDPAGLVVQSLKTAVAV